MRDDPFARLSGLDQKLFAPTPPEQGGAVSADSSTNKPTNEGTNVRPDERTSGATFGGTKGRADEGTNQRTEKRPNGPTNERTNQRTEERRDEPTKERTNVRTNQPTSGRTKGPSSGGKNGRTSGRTKRRTSQRPSELPEERRFERHPYDFYADQVLWLNRTKVEVHERYGRRITANAMVQLALDLFMQDYRERGRRSLLVRALVHGRPLSALAYRGTDGAADEGTSGRGEEN